MIEEQYGILGTATPTRHPSTDSAAAFDRISPNHSALYSICLVFLTRLLLQLSSGPIIETSFSHRLT